MITTLILSKFKIWCRLLPACAGVAFHLRIRAAARQRHSRVFNVLRSPSWPIEWLFIPRFTRYVPHLTHASIDELSKTDNLLLFFVNNCTGSDRKFKHSKKNAFAGHFFFTAYLQAQY
ncbi:hypothetical protein CEXT_281951 [Caerostris extrusa]|uniref:Secreted protein n=1 Tax=Caerostris extrusa TaxID=172846 RepID=A0AAV4QFM4_CAEEX|nr:hypothetical protein CEXT_281951 [Caerostris extrusa]